MADNVKILRIKFNGICTLTPPPPRKGAKKTKKAFVIMAANRNEDLKNDWQAPVPLHFPFVYVPLSFLQKPIPPTKNRVHDEKLGPCNVYFIDHARVVMDPSPRAGVTYFVDKRPLSDRPGSDDVAPESDIRWLADFRDILQGPAPLRKAADPRGDVDINEVAVIVDLDGGLLKAAFPCKSVQPLTFKDAAQPGIVPGIKRVLASEFSIDMTYPETVETVKLQLRELQTGTSPKGIKGTKELVLKFPAQGKEKGQPPTIEIRMGNDARDETLDYLGNTRRCNSRTRDADGKPILIPRDNDFFLHYRIIDSGRNGGPLPQSDVHQIHVDGCKSGTGG